MQRGRKKLNEDKNKRELGTFSFLRLSKQKKKKGRKKEEKTWKVEEGTKGVEKTRGKRKREKL